MNADSKGRKRHVLFVRQNGQCWYCLHPISFENWTVDHVVPLSEGGAFGFRNIVGCCFECNNQKGCMSYHRFMQSDYLKNNRLPGKHNRERVTMTAWARRGKRRRAAMPLFIQELFS